MPRDGSGNYTLPAGNPVVTDTVISSEWANSTLNDIATALTGSLPRNGTAGMTGNLPMGGNKITGLADGIAATDAVTKQQLDAFPLSQRNKFRNAGVSIKQRVANTISTSGYLMDGWFFFLGTSAVGSATYEGLTPGTAPEGLGYNVRLDITNSGNASTGAALWRHRIHGPGAYGAATFSGKTVTVSVYASANAGQYLGVSIDQNFGTGGTPSAAVQGTGQKVQLTSTLTRYDFQFNVPSVVGKTMGSNGDSNLEVIFWVSAGTSFNSRTGTLGPQTGTFRMTGFQIEEGSEATALEIIPDGLQMPWNQYYFQRIPLLKWWGYGAGGQASGPLSFNFPRMWKAPAVSVPGGSQVTGNCNGITVESTSDSSIQAYTIVTATGSFVLNLTQGLELSSEL